MAWPSLIARTKNWGTEILTDADLEGQLDLIITYINDMMDATSGHKHDATTAEGPKILISNLTIASRAQGDVYYDNGTNPTRLAAGTAGYGLTTKGASADPVWGLGSLHRRVDLTVVQASTTTMTVNPGFLDVGGAVVAKATATTLTLSTAGDWAGGGSLRAVSTHGYVGVDASGNIKMHTTAPSHADYAVSVTTGVKRYVTWSATVYRVIGWFYMNSTGSGELFSYEVGNLKDAGVSNFVSFNGAGANTTTGTTFVTLATIHHYSTGSMVSLRASVNANNGGAAGHSSRFDIDTVDITGSLAGAIGDNNVAQTSTPFWDVVLSQGTHVSLVEMNQSSGSGTMACDNLVFSIEEK